MAGSWILTFRNLRCSMSCVFSYSAVDAMILLVVGGREHDRRSLDNPFKVSFAGFAC
jgi:hypothetical protein